MLHLTPKLLRLFTWSIISATKKLTTNTALRFSVLANLVWPFTRVKGLARQTIGEPSLVGVHEELGSKSSFDNRLHKNVVSCLDSTPTFVMLEYSIV